MNRGILGLIAVLAMTGGALAIPAAVLAQSAGDEQYVDPFQEEQNQPTDGGDQGGGDSGGDDSPAATPPAAEEAPAAPAPAEPAETAVAPTQNGSATLPRTGLPVVALAAAGILLLGGGAVLRRRA